MIPTRQLHAICSWCIRNQYRSGNGCDYAGIAAKTVTYDFERLMEGAKLLKCSEFGDAIIANM